MREENFKIVLIEDIVEEYSVFFTKNYPRKKNIIEKATLPSWNFIINMTPQARNNYKHKLEDFFVFFIETVGYKDYAISECDVEVIVTKPTKRARDVDNVSYKSCFDGFVKAGLFCEDNDSVIKSLKTSIRYEKDVEKVEFIFKNVKTDGELLQINQFKQMTKDMKRESTMAEKKKNKRKRK